MTKIGIDVKSMWICRTHPLSVLSRVYSYKIPNIWLFLFHIAKIRGNDGFIGRPFVKRFAVCHPTCLSVCPVCNVGVYCGQTVGWMKMKLGTEVGLGPGQIVLDGNPASPQKSGTQQPHFSAHVLWPNGWMNQDATWYGGRSRPRPHCQMGTQFLPPTKGGTAPANFRPMSVVAKQLDGSKCHVVRRWASAQATLC